MRTGRCWRTNRTVCTISVIHSQVTDPEEVIRVLAKMLEMDEAQVRKKVEKVSSMERIRTNVAKETGDAIRSMGLDGVKVDEDFKRYYPYGDLASTVLGFTRGRQPGDHRPGGEVRILPEGAQRHHPHHDGRPGD